MGVLPPAISEKFTGNWRHKRIDKELKKAGEAYDRRAKSGRKGGEAKASNAKSRLERDASNAVLEPGSGNPSGCGYGSDSSSTSLTVVSYQDREDSSKLGVLHPHARTRGAA